MYSDVILDGLERTVLNAYHFQDAIGEMVIVVNLWNANVITGTMETFVSMRTAQKDVMTNMATAFIQIPAGATQVFYCQLNNIIL